MDTPNTLKRCSQLKVFILVQKTALSAELHPNFVLRIDSIETNKKRVPFSNSVMYFLQHLVLLSYILGAKLLWYFSTLQI